MASDTTSINVSRALKLKNRMANRLSKLETIIVDGNSAAEGNHEYDVRKAYKARMIVAADLVQLKTAISSVNAPIQKMIFEIAECKALIAMLGRVKTQHGSVSEGYSGLRTQYIAQMRKPDIDRELRRVEKEIDRIQDELDAFNHRTMLSVPTAWLTADEADPDTIVADYEQARRLSEGGGQGV